MDDFLQQGVTAYRAGKRDEARKLFANAIKQNKDDERIWGWMYNVCDTDKERIHCLKQIVRINPENEKAKQLLSELTVNDFPLERPMELPKNTGSTPAPKQHKQPPAKQKPLDPKQQKNIQIAIISIAVLCGVCFLFGAFINGKGGTDIDYGRESFVQCMVYVKSMLKSPASADFPASSSANIQELENKVFEVRSYVDAQNSFGAVIRTDFYCKVQYTGDPDNDNDGYTDYTDWLLLDIQLAE